VLALGKQLMQAAAKKVVVAGTPTQAFSSGELRGNTIKVQPVFEVLVSTVCWALRTGQERASTPSSGAPWL
jgi:hypothetical protein